MTQVADPVRARRPSDHEGQTPAQIVRRGRGGPIRVRRATLIMASSSGTPVSAIARLVAADEDTVRDVIHTFNQRGLAALDPQWAGGRPRQISDDDIAFIARDGHHPPGRGGCPVLALERTETRRPPGPPRSRPAGPGRAPATAGDPPRAPHQLPADPDVEGIHRPGQGREARPDRVRDQPLPDVLLRHPTRATPPLGPPPGPRFRSTSPSSVCSGVYDCMPMAT